MKKFIFNLFLLIIFFKNRGEKWFVLYQQFIVEIFVIFLENPFLIKRYLVFINIT